MKRKFEVNDYIQLQDIQEEYGIPFASTITGVIVELINWHYQRDYTEIYIELNEIIVPRTYRENSCVWAKRMKATCQMPHLQSYKRVGSIIVQGTTEIIYPNWFKNLKQSLTRKNILIFPIVNVPKSYQANPYLVVNRLRKIGTEITVSITKNQLTIIKQK